ncbi:bifunctional [glutamine synthetase] adenylyltransferase/[glutamine synthetase]-adenylyl-L-tyrosine phosphorylase [Sphingosinicella sp. YJ22]|uniref:bifunctional [glutamine synthetase] adenylyltransferase/[glutamine synthetase]-adenylyl-L-tyrosine phosphorylase n=1 Tax=Sphingosinicella sp. YJ22 TaxID=1104780 RepID=UPI00140ADC72|nr:bifunctional [glutamine synthetase] adenylyltransferase/[glutamine synthetase]-adenylyl-L-tyrosine phosphorylase [Sphingosinicella sp. YJ22]
MTDSEPRCVEETLGCDQDDIERVGPAVERGRTHSPFLRFHLESKNPVATAVCAGRLGEALALARAQGEDGDVMAALRRERTGHALALAIGDLAGLLTLEQVTATLSQLADRVLERAVAAAIAERCPGAPVRGFAVIALGKLGSGELNYSSDVDLLFLFDPATLPRREREDSGQAAVRIGQRVVELLQKRTEDGYAFRVDLRLRPSPEVTPIALPVDAAISHYESSALPWERSAFIRARHAAGDAALGRYFLDAIHPFVWRRSLDFGAVGEIQAVTGQIRDHYSAGQKFGPGFDLKRGRGGIREVEFYTQALQLIHGGREPQLRAPATMDALAALGAAGRIGADEAAALSDAYRLLRTIEHRVQMVDDKQTHQLPPTPEGLDNVAQLHGLADGAALLDLLRPHVESVADHYGALAPQSQTRLPGSAALEERLAGLHFPDPPAAAARIEGWRSGKARALRTAAARDPFEAMLPGLVEAFGQSSDPMAALNRFDNLVERLPSGVNFFRLLEARPAVVDYLANILSHAPTLADQLGRRSELLDGLIDASAFAPPPDVATLADDFARRERRGEDYQMLLDRVRARVNGVRFALGAQIVLARSDPLDAARGYARVAEAAIDVLARAAIAEFERQHGKVPGSELLILGLGRLGGGELTHASDLDLIYLFSGTHEAQSDGSKPLRATDYFNRLAPRVSAALSVPTAAGPLYDVDLRLRPSGRDGLLAVSLPSFADYQASHAWTFEHMALTRARPVFGSPEARAALGATVAEILQSERDPGKVAADARTMRREIARHKPAKGPFDIKLGEGGLVDLEFLVQSLQLIHRTGLDPRMDVALTALAEAGLVLPDLVEDYRLLTRMLVTFRLVSPQSAEPPPPSRALVAQACGLADWDALLEAHDEARQRVSQSWAAFAAQAEE